MTWRRMPMAVTAVLGVGVAAAMAGAWAGPLAVGDRRASAARPGPPGPIQRWRDSRLPAGNAPAVLAPVAAAQVVDALATTTAAGSFHIRYRLSEDLYPGGKMIVSVPCWMRPVDPPVRGLAPGAVQGAAASAPEPRCCSHPGRVGGGRSPVCTEVRPAPKDVPIVGSGTVDMAPLAMVVSVALAPNDRLTLRVDPQDVWEGPAADTGLVPTATRNDPVPLALFGDFARMSIGGPAEAVAMIALASPTGYLNLTASEVTAATELGRGTVGGQPVTVYQVPLGQAQIAGMGGTSPAQASAIAQALQILDGQGFTGTSVQVSVGTTGMVLASKAVATFTGGGTVTLSATLSDFGAAGTVRMPGQPAAT